MRAHATDFSPDLLAVQEQPPQRMPRVVSHVTIGLFLVLLAWASLGQLDIVAAAEGRLVPRTYSHVVQPAEAGLVRELLVREGDSVHAGQVLMRMDATTASADLNTLQAGADLRALSLRRIDAELRDQPFHPLPHEPPTLAHQVLAQYQVRRQALQDAVGQEQANLQRAQHELEAARQQLAKLQATVPMYRRSAQSYEQLVQQGFVSALGADEKQRERIEKEQELQAQQASVAALAAAVQHSQRKLAGIRSDHQTQLHHERIGLLSEQHRADGELRKQAWRSGLLELRAQEEGVVKDLVIYRPGTVVQPGAVLMKLVPSGEPLLAEVAVRNEDVGFVAAGQAVKLKLQAYPFQKYGMLGGVVDRVSPDSSSGEAQQAGYEGRHPQSFRALVRLDTQTLGAMDGERLKLTPGMAVQAEILQGRRTVLQYLLSPVQRVTYEAARER